MLSLMSRYFQFEFHLPDRGAPARELAEAPRRGEPRERLLALQPDRGELPPRPRPQARRPDVGLDLAHPHAGPGPGWDGKLFLPRRQHRHGLPPAGRVFPADHATGA
ncbi:MAG: hypothetical protein M0C28_26980 [Candidatus Moduliflexus flocculans]|nr:hypothetical protein [Candidatus Moduliflexus flocculans]